MPPDRHAAIVRQAFVGVVDSSRWHVASSKLGLFDLVTMDILGAWEMFVDDRWEEIYMNTAELLEVIGDERAHQDDPAFSSLDLIALLPKLLSEHRLDLAAGRADTIWSGVWSDVVRFLNEATPSGASYIAIVAEGSLESVLREVFEWERAPPLGWDGSLTSFPLDWLGRASVVLGIEDWSRSVPALPWALRLVDDWNEAHGP